MVLATDIRRAVDEEWLTMEIDVLILAILARRRPSYSVPSEVSGGSVKVTMRYKPSGTALTIIRTI